MPNVQLAAAVAAARGAVKGECQLVTYAYHQSVKRVPLFP